MELSTFFLFEPIFLRLDGHLFYRTLSYYIINLLQINKTHSVILNIGFSKQERLTYEKIRDL